MINGKTEIQGRYLLTNIYAPYGLYLIIYWTLLRRYSVSTDTIFIKDRQL